MKRVLVMIGFVAVLGIPAAALAQYDYPTGPSMGGSEMPGSGGVTVGSADPQTGGAGEVAIVDFAFQPMSVSVDAGSIVSWHNVGAAPHTVTAFNGAFDSGTIGSGGTYSTIFEASGVYTYHCTIHPNMVGMVSVS